MAGGIIFGVRESLLGRPDAPPGLVPLFLLSEMVAIVALHLLHRGRERYGRGGALASVTAFVGVALMAGGYMFIERISPTMFWGYMFIVGVLVAPIGILVLAIVTLDAGVLPRWGGWALIAGNPLLGGFILVVTNALVSPIGSWLVAVPWIVVGFAVFRAAGLRTERPSRVR